MKNEMFSLRKNSEPDKHKRKFLRDSGRATGAEKCSIVIFIALFIFINLLKTSLKFNFYKSARLFQIDILGGIRLIELYPSEKIFSAYVQAMGPMNLINFN